MVLQINKYFLCTNHLNIPSKNRLARNIRILQGFSLQDLQDLALNLASLALKMKLFLQDVKVLQESCKKSLQDNFLAKI